MKNGSAAVTTSAAEPNEMYDTLDASGQKFWDLIGSLGFRPDKDEKDRWIALSMKGDDKFGPCTTLADLAEEVQAFADKADETLLTEDHKGNPYLPGAEEVVDKQIAAAAGKYHSVKMERCELSRQETVAKDELVEICHAKRHLFKADPENSNSKIYRAGGIIVRIKNEWTEKIETQEATEE